MKLTSQVCTLAQAKRLKQLGITQESLFCFYPNNINVENDDFELVTFEESRTFRADWYEERIHAFTVAELCAMLLCDANEKSGWNVYWKKGKFQILYRGDEVKQFTNQAEALAYLLILLIEKGFTMPEMCNERLLNA